MRASAEQGPAPLGQRELRLADDDDALVLGAEDKQQSRRTPLPADPQRVDVHHEPESTIPFLTPLRTKFTDRVPLRPTSRQGWQVNMRSRSVLGARLVVRSVLRKHRAGKAKASERHSMR